MKYIYIVFLLFTIASCKTDSSEPQNRQAEEETKSISLESAITCPHCGFTKTETLPTEYCLFKYTCEGCGKTITPKDGDCCVFCSYATHECPSIQEEYL